ncbi:MAG TPA: carotenoid oxygenase family protein [Candidatus Binatia bacterium]|jgi:carotenoid cleavage dioxygenase|nr:carotenoid oxygenase family protein [Candidatus Binatia bacterium]
MTDTANHYLGGNFAPVHNEVTAFDLQVVGHIPSDLEGRYLRNGPNPISVPDASTHHWFIGNGMVHGVRLRGGKAEWYRNRWVRTDGVREELGERPRTDTVRPPNDVGPNTNVGGWAGTTWAMVEAGAPPVELTYDLDSVGVNAFYGTLPGAFSAHPKFDPVTRELHAMCYAWQDWLDHIQYVVVGADGRVTKTLDIPMNGMVMLHDMSLTRKYAVIYDLPVTLDPELAMAGRFPFRWNPAYEPRIGLLPRDGGVDDIVWCAIEPGYGYHPVNAYDAPDGSVVIDICRYERMFDHDLVGPFGDCLATLDRWTVDPKARRVRTERIDDRTMEFPRVAGSVSTQPHRYAYVAGVGEGYAPGPLYKHDVRAGTLTEHDYGRGRGTGEVDFVARPNATSEDDGWLLSYVFDATRNKSDLVILDALDLKEVGRVLLPQRVPFGFHGNWVGDRTVAPSV